jgi:hypothetical protein
VESWYKGAKGYASSAPWLLNALAMRDYRGAVSVHELSPSDVGEVKEALYTTLASDRRHNGYIWVEKFPMNPSNNEEHPWHLLCSSSVSCFDDGAKNATDLVGSERLATALRVLGFPDPRIRRILDSGASVSTLNELTKLPQCDGHVRAFPLQGHTLKAGTADPTALCDWIEDLVLTGEGSGFLFINGYPRSEASPSKRNTWVALYNQEAMPAKMWAR